MCIGHYRKGEHLYLGIWLYSKLSSLCISKRTNRNIENIQFYCSYELACTCIHHHPSEQCESLFFCCIMYAIKKTLACASGEPWKCEGHRNFSIPNFSCGLPLFFLFFCVVHHWYYNNWMIWSFVKLPFKLWIHPQSRAWINLNHNLDIYPSLL